MGRSRTPKELGDKITKMATITQRRQAETVAKGALLAKDILIDEAAARGVAQTSKIAGAKWGVRYDVKGFNQPTAIVKVIGPFHLVDGPTKSHQIGPRRSGRRRSGKRAVTVGPDRVYAHVEHPGTRGKGIFAAAKTKAYVLVPRHMGRNVIGGWEEGLRG